MIASLSVSSSLLERSPSLDESAQISSDPTNTVSVILHRGLKASQNNSSYMDAYVISKHDIVASTEVKYCQINRRLLTVFPKR